MTLGQPDDDQVLLELAGLDAADRLQLAAALDRLTTLRSLRPRVAALLHRAAGHTRQTIGTTPKGHTP